MNTICAKLGVLVIATSFATASRADTWLPIREAAKTQVKQKPAHEMTLQELEDSLAGKTGKSAAEIAEIDFGNECNEQRAQVRDQLYVDLGIEDLKRYNSDISERVGEEAFRDLDIESLARFPDPKASNYIDLLREYKRAHQSFITKSRIMLDKAGKIIAGQNFERNDIEAQPRVLPAVRQQRTWQGKRDSVLFYFPHFSLSRKFLSDTDHDLFKKYNTKSMISYLGRDQYSGEMKIEVSASTTNSQSGRQLLSSFVEEKISEECRQRSTPNETLIMAMNSDDKTVGEAYSRMFMSKVSRARQDH